jgi:addiction module RelE/StbE family toxin
MKQSKEEMEKHTVNITQNAENDLNEIVEYISQNNPQTALKILEKIQNKIKTLDHFPYRGGYVPELLEKNIKEYRQLLETPWKIIYKVENEQVTILTIIDSRRNLQDILIKKLIKENG